MTVSYKGHYTSAVFCLSLWVKSVVIVLFLHRWLSFRDFNIHAAASFMGAALDFVAAM